MVLGLPRKLGLPRPGQKIEPVYLPIIGIVNQIVHYRAVGPDHVRGLWPEEVYDRGVFIVECLGEDGVLPSLSLPIVMNATFN